jgi:D-alanyl-lipoteichoic acid acyltransferase DltB (MBOAT superfamily)
MLFNSAIFVFVFLPLVWIGYLLSLRLPWARAGIGWLGLASIFFYGYWNPAFLPLLVASILFNYGAGRLLDRSLWNGPAGRRKILLIGAIAANLAVLAYYKYANLLSSSVGALTGVATPVFDVLLPIGISFYTFTQIAYLADSYRAGKSEKSFSAYFLFVTFFPHLIAGPVLHHSEMMPQFLRDARRIAPAVVLEGLLFFACGLAKKVLIADSVAPTVNRVFLLAESNALGAADSWFGALAYTTQIYFDFSGYSDMAVGLGLLFGIRLPLNFNSPYKSVSVIEFWRRWHMTLSSARRACRPALRAFRAPLRCAAGPSPSSPWSSPGWCSAPNRSPASPTCSRACSSASARSTRAWSTRAPPSTSASGCCSPSSPAILRSCSAASRRGSRLRAACSTGRSSTARMWGRCFSWSRR